MKNTLILLFLVSMINLTLFSQNDFPVPMISFEPLQYACYHTAGSIEIDGKLDEESWIHAPWTQKFVDIEGYLQSAPYYDTKVKMLWDEQYFYIGAELIEPHVWGTLTERDAVIFYDNDFEVFIDPNGDTHDYYELEINALGTVWDLFLIKPYRDWHSVAVDSWDIQGLKSAIFIDGTLNDPSDIDRGWYVELAIPWKVLEECAYQKIPPQEGDYWRVNFSRVQWHHTIIDGKYVKEDAPEKNWVWSPQGLINMHYPEMWGFVYFTNGYVSKSVMFIPKIEDIEYVKWGLRQIYYFQKEHFMNNGFYTTEITALDNDFPYDLEDFDHPDLYITPSMWQAVSRHKSQGFTVNISQDGRTWIETNK
jgi:hypothetical protein